METRRFDMQAGTAAGDWRDAAVEARDARAAGQFVLGVVTTGIYCRPGCPARTPRPENRRYFPDCDAAEEAGYRACKRCRPRDVADNPVTRACRFIEASVTLPTLDAMAAAAGLSPFHFHRAFKAATGVTPRAWAVARRAERLQAALAEGQTVTTAIHGAGYATAGRAYAEAPARLGMAPRKVRARGAGERIRAAVAMTSLGALLVAATDMGVVRIAFGDEGVLIETLRRDYAAAEIETADPAFRQTVDAVVALVEKPEVASGSVLPLDVRGTAFQQQVWAALRAIPPGRTVTYAEVAAAIGRPSATRAVAGACAANELALAIPCHRVVPAAGGAGGYRWGEALKAALLRREGALQ
jgi:AraC family transcriptional regulator of adaptative response/methylated-DNA-[protein]-cysteine methyltransferase